jgi:hypothetical protein
MAIRIAIYYVPSGFSAILDKLQMALGNAAPSAFRSPEEGVCIMPKWNPTL